MVNGNILEVKYFERKLKMNILFKIKRYLYKFFYKKPINIDKHTSWYKWLEMNWYKDSLYPPPISSELALCFLSDYLLNEKVLIQDIVVYDIALKIIKKYSDKPIKIDKSENSNQIMNKLFETMYGGYISIPINQQQCNTEIVSGILQKYSDDYNEEYEFYAQK